MPTNWHVFFGVTSDSVLASLSNCHPLYPQPHKLLLDSGVLYLDVPQDVHFTYQDQFPICLLFSSVRTVLSTLSPEFRLSSESPKAPMVNALKFLSTDLQTFNAHLNPLA